MKEDTEENYRDHLAYLLSRTKSRGHGRYYNQFANRCKDEAAQAFPLGAAAARKSDIGKLGFWGVIFAALDAILG